MLDLGQDLRDAIIAVMSNYGKKSLNRDGDYDCQNMGPGLSFQFLDLNTLALLRMDILGQLQLLLKNASDTHIKVMLDVPGTEVTWPVMGVSIYRDRIDDHLIRKFLPEEIRDQAFGIPVSGPLVSPEEAEEMIAAARKNFLKNR